MESPRDIFEPDKFRFVGPAREKPRIVEEAQQDIEYGTIQMPPEREKSPERIQQLYGIVHALNEFAKNELRIDLIKRLPGTGQFHFFDENGYQELNRTNNRPKGSVAFCFLGGDISVQEQSSIEETLANANHELIHVTSYQSISLCQERGGYSIDIEQGHSGYANERNQALAMIEEGLTELTNIQVMMLYWKHEQALTQMDMENYRDIGYPEQVIIIDELIKRIAHKQGQPYQDILRGIQRGKFLGQMQSLRIFTEEIGKDGMKILAKWTFGHDQSVAVAKALGLTEAQKKLHALQAGEKVSFDFPFSRRDQS